MSLGSRCSRVALGFVAAWISFCVVGSQASAAGVTGKWASPVGMLEIREKGGKVTGRLMGDSAVCPFKKGDTVVSGSVVEDSITGDVRLCQTGAACGGELKGFGLLLVSGGGAKLSGAVYVSPKAGCSVPGRGPNGGVTFLKMGGLPKKGTKIAAAAAGAAVTKPGQKSLKKKKRRKKRKKKQPKKDPAKAKAEPAQGGQPSGPVRIGDDSDEDGYDLTRAQTARQKAEPHMIQGAQLLGAGQFKQARDHFQQAIEIDPSWVEAYNGVGVTYYATKLYDEAMVWYKKAIAVHPDFGDAYYNMGCLYALQKKPRLALRYLKISAMNGYTEFAKMRDDPDLQNLKGNRDFERLTQGKF